MRDWKLVAALLGVASCLMLCSLFEGFSILLLFGAAVAGLALLWGAFKYPEFFLVATLFIPQLKAYWPLRSIDHAVDPTVVMLAGLLIGVCWCGLKFSARLDGLRRPHLSFLPRWPIVFFILFAVIVGLSYLHTPAASYGGTKLVRFLAIGILLFVAPFFIIRSDRDLRRFILLFLGAGLILALQMILHLNDRQSTSDNDITRIGAGWLMGMLVLLALYYRPFRRDSYNSVMAWSLVPIYGTALVASAARGPMVALLIVLVLNLAISAKPFSKVVLAVALLCASGYAAFSVFSHVDPSKYHSKFSEIVNLSEGKAASGSAVQRLIFYRQTLAAIPKHLVLGQGVGSWSVFYYGDDERGYPHNLMLEVAFEEGLVGVASLCLFLFAVGAASVRLLRITRNRYVVFPSLVLFCLIVSMFSGDLDDNRILWFWAGITLAICAIAAAQLRGPFLQRHMYRRYRIRTAVPSLPGAEVGDGYSSPA